MARLGDQIDRMLKRTGKSRSALARHLEISTQAVGGWISGGSEPLPAKRRRIAEFFGISEEELLFGPSHGRKPLSMVPIIRWDEATNPSRYVDNANSTNHYPTYGTSAAVNATTFALCIKSDSMINPTGYPSFPPGTIIVCEPDLPADPGDYVLAKQVGVDDALFGQLVVEAGRRYLKPLNTRYPLIELAPGDDVVAVVREYGAKLK